MSSENGESQNCVLAVIYHYHSINVVIIAGDLNAGGSYVRPADWAMCRLRGPQYGWLIADHQDTTATNTLAAYDRILTCSHSVHEAVVTDSAGVYRFDEDLGLDEETTLKVSDHFPVFCSLKPSVHPAVMKNIQTLMAIYVVDKVKKSQNQFLIVKYFLYVEASKLRLDLSQ